MGVHIEAQDNNEVMHVRSRELQLENTQKLKQMEPIVQTLENVDLQFIENTTNDIKDMIVTNIDDQVDLNEIANTLEKVAKSQTELKKSITRLNNTMKDVIDQLNKFDGDIDG